MHCRFVFNFDVRFKNIEVKSGSKKSSVACPLFASTEQQTITNPLSTKTIKSKLRGLWLLKIAYA